MNVKGGLGEIEALPKFAAGARRGFLEDPESKLPRGSLELHTDVSRVTGCMSAFTGGGSCQINFETRERSMWDCGQEEYFSVAM